MAEPMRRPYGPFGYMYDRFFEEAEKAKGYDFGYAPMGSMAPPRYQPTEPLRGWSMDRPERLREIRRFRDSLIEAILALGDHQKVVHHVPAPPCAGIPSERGDENRDQTLSRLAA